LLTVLVFPLICKHADGESPPDELIMGPGWMQYGVIDTVEVLMISGSVATTWVRVFAICERMVPVSPSQLNTILQFGAPVSGSPVLGISTAVLSHDVRVLDDWLKCWKIGEKKSLAVAPVPSNAARSEVRKYSTVGMGAGAALCEQS
jgi:hypothetical protein